LDVNGTNGERLMGFAWPFLMTGQADETTEVIDLVSGKHERNPSSAYRAIALMKDEKGRPLIVSRSSERTELSFTTIDRAEGWTLQLPGEKQAARVAKVSAVSGSRILLPNPYENASESYLLVDTKTHTFSNVQAVGRAAVETLANGSIRIHGDEASLAGTLWCAKQPPAVAGSPDAETLTPLSSCRDAFTDRAR
jgi:hypothetical protein